MLLTLYNAQGCDLMVGATALQIAAPSIAQQLGIPYVFAAYCPAVLLSSYHAPPMLAMLGSGAWLLQDARPLAPQLAAFLDAGAPPIYLRFGSVRTPPGLSEAMLQVARVLGRQRWGLGRRPTFDKRCLTASGGAPLYHA